jgi:hypothetical protein
MAPRFCEHRGRLSVVFLVVFLVVFRLSRPV